MVFCFVSIPVFAKESSIYIPETQVWSDRDETSDSRTGNYNTVYAKCKSVYPTDGGADYFEIIQCRITNMYGTNIGTTSYVLLDEVLSGSFSEITVAEKYLSDKTVYFEFRGNKKYDAYAVVEYSGR